MAEEKTQEKPEKEEKSAEELYSELVKKYSELPDFDLLNNAFEISTVESKDFLLREIIKKIIERMQGFSQLIEELMQGDAKLSNMYEWKTLDDDMKKKITEIYRDIMIKIRAALELSLDSTEAKEADFVKELYENWQKLKPRLKNLVLQLKEAWKKDVDAINERLEYMG